MAGYGQKEDELDGSINCNPLIDGLLIKKAVSQTPKKIDHSSKPGITPSSGMSALNRCAGSKELLLMVDQGIVFSSCGTSTMRI